MALTSQRPLGSLLVEMGFVDPSQLEAALADQQRTKKRLGKLLIEAGVITEDRLVHALSHQLGIEACDPIMTPVHEAVLAMVPSPLAFEHRVLPVARQRDGEAEILYVATADPLDQAAGEAVRKSVPASTQVRWMLAGETEMDLALARHYGAAPTESKPKTSEPAVRVIAGTPVAPPRRPDEQSMAPLHSTGDIFAALQEAVELSGDVTAPLAGDATHPPAPTEPVDFLDGEGPRPAPSGEHPAPSGEPPTPSGERPAPFSERRAPSTASRDLEVVFPGAPPGLPDIPVRGPDDSHPSLDLPRLQGSLHDQISDEILQAEEVIEADVEPEPEAAPVAHAAPAPQIPAEDPVVPPPQAEVVPAGPSWGDMLGAAEDDEGSEDLPDLARAEAAATVLPAATDSLAQVPAPAGPPEEAEAAAPVEPAVPVEPPTELELGEVAQTVPLAFEAPVESLDDLAGHDGGVAPAPFDLPSEVSAPPFEVSAAAELGLPPLAATPMTPAPEVAPVESLAEPVAPASLPFEVEAPAESIPTEPEPAAEPAAARARDLVARYAGGEELAQDDLQWMMRLLAATLLRGPLADDARLAEVLDEVGPPPG